MNYRFPFEKFVAAVACLVMLACNSDKQPDLVTPTSNDPKIQKLKVPEGFVAERLYSPGEHEQGSWVSMAFDDKGRMIVSDQYGDLYRLNVPPQGDSSVPKVEKLVIGKRGTADTATNTVEMGYAQGLLYAFNSLYVMVNHESDERMKRGSGLYRLQDTDGDDQFDKITEFKSLAGEGEHGPHSIKLSPDKKSLYLISGNHTDVPKMNSYRLPSNWKEDNLFPLIKDPNGHANDRYAPGGWIAHIDSLGKNWELISAGYRNAFDIAFNDAGDLFAYDSDMEWDFGMPWYRPTRIVHVTSGSEFGWRTGNSKWSPSFPDNLPALLNIGQGSPTNLVYAGEAKFPKKYRESLLAFDWSFGIIYSIQTEPKGSTYSAKAEEFISGSPLPLTDGTIGPDGALYFLTGGRRLESDLYRITYRGKEETERTATANINQENQLRRQIETYHTKKAGAVEFAWPHLKSDDRFIRYAARIAIEHQPVAEWQEKVLNEKDPVTLIQGAVSLARQGKPDAKTRLLNALNALDFTKLNSSQQIDILRAYELIFARMGDPDPQTKSKLIASLDPHYPASDNFVNREFSKIMIHLQAPSAVSKTMALFDKAKDDTSDQKTFTESSDLIFRNPQYGLDIANMLSKVPPAQQTYYAVMLSAAKTGWTPELQEKYFTWFSGAFGFKGGVSYVGFIDKARKLALANVPKNQFAHFNTISGDSLVAMSGKRTIKNLPQPKGPGRDWELDSAVAVVDSGMQVKRDFAQGKMLYDASLCSSCHRMRGEGSDIGPDLSQIGTRFSTKDIIEAIIEPSKTVSDQYAATIFTLKGGSTIVGKLVNQDGGKYVVSQNPFAPQSLRDISKNDVVSTKLSNVSIMLPKMINRLNPEELKDLMAFLKAGGNKDHDIYKKK